MPTPENLLEGLLVITFQEVCLPVVVFRGVRVLEMLLEPITEGLKDILVFFAVSPFRQGPALFADRTQFILKLEVLLQTNVVLRPVHSLENRGVEELVSLLLPGELNLVQEGLQAIVLTVPENILAHLVQERKVLLLLLDLLDLSL